MKRIYITPAVEVHGIAVEANILSKSNPNYKNTGANAGDNVHTMLDYDNSGAGDDGHTQSADGTSGITRSKFFGGGFDSEW